MSERDTGSGNSRQSGPGGDKQRKEAAKSFFARVVCVVGILLGLVGLANPFFTGPVTTLDVSIQAVGIWGTLPTTLWRPQARDRGGGLVYRCDLLRSCHRPGPHPRHPGRRPQPPLRRARLPETRLLRMVPPESVALGLCTARVGVPFSEGTPGPSRRNLPTLPKVIRPAGVAET